MAPRDVALKIVDQMPSSELVEKLEVAGPGFVNIWLKHELIQTELNTLLDKVRAGNIWLKHELIQTELNTLLDKVSSAGNIWLKHELIQTELNTLPDKLTAVHMLCLDF
jgi:arginyl-tRNA synthetase